MLVVVWPNRPPAGAAGVEVADAAVAAVPGVVVAAEPPNKPPVGAAAGVAEGAAVDEVPPREGKRDFWGVALDVAEAPNERGVFAVEAGAPRAGKADLVVESPPGAGALLKRDGVCELCAPVAGAAAPKSDLGAASAVVAGVVDSAGLFAPANRLPLDAAAGVPLPNIGFVVAAPPKRLLDGCDCEVAGVVDDGAAAAGVFENAGFAPPKRLLGGLDAGGGPAGVVELLPNREPPAGAGVAVGAALPNKVFVFDPPNGPLLEVGVVDSVVLLGV